MVYSVDVAKIDVGDTVNKHPEDIICFLVQMDGSYQRKASIIKGYIILTHRACIFTSAHHMWNGYDGCSCGWRYIKSKCITKTKVRGKSKRNLKSY